VDIFVVIRVDCSLNLLFLKFKHLLLLFFRDLLINRVSVLFHGEFSIIVDQNCNHFVTDEFLFFISKFFDIRMRQSLLDSESIIWVKNE